MKTVEIEIYQKNHKYFVNEITKYRIGKLGNPDKIFFGFAIRNKLSDKGIGRCLIYPVQNGKGFSVDIETLEGIAIDIYYNPGGDNLEVEVKNKVHKNDR